MKKRRWGYYERTGKRERKKEKRKRRKRRRKIQARIGGIEDQKTGEKSTCRRSRYHQGGVTQIIQSASTIKTPR